MNISDTAKNFQEPIQAWAKERGGVCSIVSNLKDMWEQAYQASEKPRIFICYNGEHVRGEFALAAYLARVDRQWQVAVTRGRGFSLPRGLNLVNQVQNSESFYDSVEAIREIIRMSLNTSVELPVDFKGIRPMASGNLIIDGYIIEFSTAADLPRVAETPNDPTPDLPTT